MILLLEHYLQIQMQSISQGSLKLEAYHDKIINEGANKTKLEFLIKEYSFLKELKEESESLQMIVRKQHSTERNVRQAADNIDKIREMLEKEVVRTRRETALLQMQSSNLFQSRVQGQYEASVLKIGERLEKIEEVVQKAEEQKRSNYNVVSQKFVNLKERFLKPLMEKNIQKREAVKRQLTRRLFLGGWFQERQQQLKEHPLKAALKDNLSMRCFHFLQKHKRYYRSKSTERESLEPQLPQLSNQVRQMIQNRPRKQQISLKTRTNLSDLNNSLLLALQDQIYQEGIAKFKLQNNHLQLKIDMFKNAIQKRQSLQTYNELLKEQQIEAEGAKAREFLAYIQMQSTFKDKLQSCSYKWAHIQNIQPKAKILSKEWTEEASNYFSPYLKLNKPKSKSLQKNYDQPLSDFVSLKSYQKTNASLQRF